MTAELVKRVNKLEEAVLKAGAGGFGAQLDTGKGKKDKRKDNNLFDCS